MPRFFFDIADGWESRDPEGVDFPDLPAARTYTLKLASEVIRMQAGDFDCEKPWRFVLRDHTRTAVFQIDVVCSEANATSPAQLVSARRR